ncbi:MAG: tRNA pseudouridine(38-40) synthase TruA, partial [Bacteroidota bacterium]
FITLSYNGSNFNGWQIQLNTPNTIQQVLEDNFNLIFKEKVAVTGCGRTDAGVHARNYVAHIDLHKDMSLEELNKITFKLNKILPSSISIQIIEAVKAEAHARFDATSRVYQYYICRQKNPFRDTFRHYVYGDLNFELMNQAAKLLCEYEDFTSFSKLHTQNKNNLCKISYAQGLPCGEKEWLFKITANRFLRGMVRAIVGTLLQVGRNKISIEEFKTIIEAKNRSKAGENVPAHALFLCGIQYPKHIYH